MLLFVLGLPTIPDITVSQHGGKILGCFFSVIKEYLIILRAIARVSYHSDCKDVILQGYVIFQGPCLGMKTMKKNALQFNVS